MAAIIVFIIGLAALFNGVSILSAANSAMHQIYGGIYVAGGVVTIALAFVTSAVGSAVKVLREIRDKPPAVALAAVPSKADWSAAAAGSSSYAECPACGRENRADARVCQCGNRLTAA